jgi:hypothetical protein
MLDVNLSLELGRERFRAVANEVPQTRMRERSLAWAGRNNVAGWQVMKDGWELPRRSP